MEFAFLFLATLGAYFVKGITGFGNTLVMGTLFSFVVPNKTTTPVDLLISIPTNSFLVWRERKSIRLKVALPLSLLLLIGIIPGTFLLKIGYDWILKSALGLLIMGLAAEMYFRKPATQDKKINPLFLTVIGVVSGVLAGLYGISALIIAYISRITTDRGQFRANMCLVFLVDNVFRFFLYLFTGILTWHTALLTLELAPAVVLGMFLGVKADKHLNDAAVRKVVVAVLLLSGLLLFGKNIFLFHIK